MTEPSEKEIRRVMGRFRTHNDNRHRESEPHSHVEDGRLVRPRGQILWSTRKRPDGSTTWVGTRKIGGKLKIVGAMCFTPSDLASGAKGKWMTKLHIKEGVWTARFQ